MTVSNNNATFTPATAVAGTARSAMLVDLCIRTYSGRKQDKRTQDEVTASKGAASKRAASVYKSLFAECKELEDITKFQARARQTHYRYTKPWSDSGTRLLPLGVLGDYKEEMNKCEEEFYALVDKFLDKYDTLVAAAAFQLGTLFDRSEYPTRAYVRSRFEFSVHTSPMPLAGDFRLDVEAEVQQELIAEYEKRMAIMLERANQDSWEKLYKVLSNMSDRLTTDLDSDKPRRFHDTLVSNAEELCDLLTRMNVTSDPELEKARYRLQDALIGVSPQALRQEASTRLDVKTKVDKILADFDWGIEDDADDASDE